MKTRPVTVSAPALGQGSSLPPPRTGWEITYRRAVFLADLVVIVVAARVGLIFHDGSFQLGSSAWPGALALGSTIALVAGLAGRRCWDLRILGQGAEEFRRIGAAVGTAIVVLALAGLAVHASNLGAWVFGVLPATGVALAFTRYGLRRVLHARRSRGGCMVPVLVAGSVEEVADLIARTRREAHQDRPHHPEDQEQPIPAPGNPRPAPQPPKLPMTSRNDFAHHPGLRRGQDRARAARSRRRTRTRTWSVAPSQRLGQLRQEA